VTWTIAYSQIGPGAWLICPVGGLQTLLTSQAAASYILPTLVALLLFLLPIFILGNVFCSWVCPVGTLIDSFDKAVSKWLPKIDAKRQQRLLRDKEKRKISAMVQSGLAVNLLGICPNCFVGKVFGDKHVNLANGVLVTSLIGSAIFRFPIFCTLCPIGVVTRGMFHLKAWTFLTNTMMPIILELTIIPIVAVLASLREKRYWCRKICPVGATLNIAGSASPFFKPNIKTDQYIAKKSIEPKEESASNQNRVCPQINCQHCESICPQGINLTDNESLVKCTKCLDCYITCPQKAITLKVVNTPEAIIWLKRVLKRKPTHQ
jgi:polyferredoxin